MFIRTLLGFSLAVVLSNDVFGNDVTVRYRNGDVFIVGDDRGNSIEIRNLGFYVHEIKGVNGTTINRSTRPITVPILDDLRINMEGGNDSVRIKSLRLTESAYADLTIKLGEGDDLLRMDHAVISQDLQILCNSEEVDNDTVEIRESKADLARIHTQDVSEVTLMHNEFNLELDTGKSGGDTLNIVGNNFGERMVINASDEDDYLWFYGNRLETTFWNGIYLHDGDDRADVWMEWYHHLFPSPFPLRLNAGDGFDLMLLKGSGNFWRFNWELVDD